MPNKVLNTPLHPGLAERFDKMFFSAGPEHIYAEIYPQDEKEKGKQVCFIVIS